MIPDCTAEEESDKGDKLHAGAGANWRLRQRPAAANLGSPLREQLRQTL